ncbi:MATE family efflux transporter [Pseudaeromonas sp. ZJS20]|uniref:MATE family efflux transporter n=1 Tax=Pseudaeromonas aegiceratis TaxID=3153928 RepID=UPI00390C5CAE
MASSSHQPGSLFQLTWPLFIDLAFHFLTGALNTFMVGHVSYQAVAALAVGNQILDLCITLFNFIGIGCSVVIAQYLGSGNRRMAREVVHTAIGFNLMSGALVMLAVLLGADSLLRLMNMPANLMQDGHTYLTIIGLLMVPEAVSLCLAASLRAHGHTREAMYVTLVANFITFVGNALLLFGWFGLPQMGVAGVAWSTIVGRLVAVALLIYLLQARTGIRLHPLRFFHWSRAALGKVLHIGLPAAGENFSWMLQFMVVTSFVALLGDKALATQSFFFQICLFLMLFGLSIGLGTEILIGHLVGAGKFDQAYHQLLRSLKLGLMVSAVVVVPAAFGGGHFLMSLFTDDQEIVAMATQLFFISMLLEPGRTFNIVVINSLRATGDARFPLMMAILSMWGLAIPLAWFLGLHLGWGLVGIWLAFAADEWTRGLAMYWRWKSRRWEKKVLVSALAEGSALQG